jgi:quercetin dioxygenase-like cupin family protein
MFRPKLPFLTSIVLLASIGPTTAQYIPGGTCKPVGERTSEIGCWILVNAPIGHFQRSDVFWHLDAYPTRAAAEQAKGDHSQVVEAFGKTWLLTVEREGWRATGAEHVADIGPLRIGPGTPYSTQYMEAVFAPGMTSAAHTHSGPEAWYTVAGEMCLETPQGKQVGRAGGQPVIIEGGPPMHLTATGTDVRKALVLILYDSSQRSTTLEHE